MLFTCSVLNSLKKNISTLSTFAMAHSMSQVTASYYHKGKKMAGLILDGKFRIDLDLEY